MNSHALKDYGRIVSGAPACLYTMETLYKAAGHGVETRFEHVAEILSVSQTSTRSSGAPGRNGSPSDFTPAISTSIG